MMNKNEIRQEELRLEQKKNEVVAKYPDGIEVSKLAQLIGKEYSFDYLKYYANIILKKIDNMAIICHITCCPSGYEIDEKLAPSFIFNFNDENKPVLELNKMDFKKVIIITLTEVLTYKYTYKRTFEYSLFAELFYRLTNGRSNE
jgi:hypothetical protein